MFKDTCAVIVTYNPDLTEVKTLIERIVDHVGAILIVDNGSKNVDDLRSLPATLAELGENRGVATAQNIGIEMALRNHAFVLLFDHDSLPAPDMVPKLREAYDALTQQGIRVAAVGANYIERNFGRLQESERRTGWVKKKAIISSGTLFSAEALRDVGPMLDDLFIDHIDEEWCMRATHKWLEHNSRVETQRCWKIYMVRDALMGHSLGSGFTRIWAGMLSTGMFSAFLLTLIIPRAYAPFGVIAILIAAFRAGSLALPVHSPMRRYYIFRNTVHLFLRSPYPLSWKLRMAALFVILILTTLFNAFPGGYWQHIRMILLGTWHGIRGKLGPYPAAIKEKKSLASSGSA